MISYWNNLKIGTKMGLCFGVVTMIIVSVLFGMKLLSDKLTAYADEALDQARQTAFLTAREVDHLNWRNSVAEYIAARGKKSLKVQLDGSKCSFGIWLSGPEKEHLETMLPEARALLAAIDDPHRRLHASGADIVRLMEARDFAGADAMFYGVTKDFSEQVAAKLNDLRLLVQKRGQGSEAEYRTMADRLSTLSFVIIAVIFIGSIVFSIVITRALSGPLAGIAEACRAVTAGEERSFPVDREDEVGDVARALSAMVDKVRAMMCEAQNSAEDAHKHAEAAEKSLSENVEKNEQIGKMLDTMMEVSDQAAGLADDMQVSVENLARRAEQARDSSREQQARMETVSSSMEEIKTTIGDIASRALSAADSATQSLEKARYGAGVVVQSIDAIQKVDGVASRLRDDIQELGGQATSIGTVMNMITDIADQTNLLALNAAIEAARAGDAGRGFAVVADEVRKLAEKTMQATREVGENIASIQNSIGRSVSNMEEASEAVARSSDLANESGQSLKEIVDIASRNMEDARTIANATELHAAASERIVTELEVVAMGIEENVASMEQSAELINNEQRAVEELRSTIARLKIQ